jgi:putative MATE family efflux protein
LLLTKEIISMTQNKMFNVLADERIGPLLFKLTLPAFFGMLVMTLYNVTDTIFIGQYVGSLGIAGLSIVFPVQMLAMGIGQMTGMGGASVISRLLGARNTSRAEHTLGNSLAATAILTAAIAIVGLANIDGWLRLIGASESILPYARDYMSIILYGLIFQTFSMACNGLTRSVGNAPVSMTGMIIGAVLNVILCAIFIIPLHMGVKGSALATVIAEFISCAYYVRYYISDKSPLKIRLSNLIPNLDILKPVFAIGISSLTQTLANSLSAMLVNRSLLTYGGDYAVATFGILNRIMMFSTMPGMVVGMGLQPILGFNYGAKRYDLALKVIKLSLIWSACMCLLAFVFVYSFPGIFIRVFSSDPILIDTGIQASHIIYLALYLLGFVFVGPMIFQATGKALKSFITSLARPALFLIPLILILPRFWQLNGVWAAYPLTDFLAVVLSVILLIPQIQELRKGAREISLQKVERIKVKTG